MGNQKGGIKIWRRPAGLPTYLGLQKYPPATSVEYFSGLIQETYQRRRIVETGNAMVKNAHRPDFLYGGVTEIVV